MENKKSSETLEEGFVESKVSQTEHSREKILEEADSVILCNLNAKCTADACSDNSEVRNVDTARKLGNGSIEESVVCDSIAGNNLIDKGTLESYPDDKLLALTNNEKKDNDVPVLEENLKFSGNDGIQIGRVEELVEKSDDELHSHEHVQVENVEETMEKSNDVLHPHEPGSPTKIEISGNGINLFVEVFGPLDGISESNNNRNDTGEHVLGESDSNQDYSLKENGTLFPDVKNASAKNEGEDIVRKQECTFDMGDLVWVKTRTQLWWPGMISNPSNAANDATKSEKKGSFFVKYFGNANFAWCNNSDLKAFLEYFEEMSRQNKSKSFFGSVERALGEIGRRVKSKMTCPCFSKESQKLAAQWLTETREESSMSMHKEGKSDVLSLSQFEPATFFGCIRHLARSVYIPGKIELTVIKNRLSAFYCSIGHYGLPLQLLRSSSDAAQNAQDGMISDHVDDGHDNNCEGGCRNSVKAREDGLNESRRRRRRRRNRSDDADLVLDNKIASSDKGSESRERKKSKYLSYPYVDVNRGLDVASNSGQETEDVKHCSSLSTKSTPLGSCSGMNSRKRGSRKPSKGHHMVSKADDINACSAELLAELCSTARDCFYLSRSKYQDSLKIFYCSFKIFAFLDAEIASKDAGIQEVRNHEKSLTQNSAESEVQMEGSRVTKESEDQKLNLASAKESVKNTVGNKISKTDNVQAKGNVTNRMSKKKKKQAISAGVESVGNYLSMGANFNPNSSCMISFQHTCSDVPKSRTAEEREEATSGDPQIVTIARLPDLNGNQSSFSVEQIPVGGPARNLGNSLPEQKDGIVSQNINGIGQIVFTSVPSLKDVPVTLQNTPQLNAGVSRTNQCRNTEFAPRELEPDVLNSGLGSFVQQSFQTGFLSSVSKPERKKRKRKACQVASVIPDLNGTVLDTSSLGKTFPEGIQISPEGKPQQKRRRNKSASVESGSNMKTDKVSNNGEALGGSLLLNFAPGSSLPSKETLVATFSRFGLLKESEIQFLDDSSVQIVYERSSEARFAFRSLEKSNPYGESLANFKLHCMPSKITEKKKALQMPKPFLPVEACKNPAKPGETPDIGFIRQNVEMMKLTLEKAGDNLSPEMRAKLENEINVFLDKISSVAGPPSS